MDLTKFIEWAFEGVLSSCMIYGLNIISQMKNSINELNNNVSRIVEKTAWHEKELDKLDERIRLLENQR